ncbi:hypothetical protein N7530_001980 [Penicillium desertorum]|uniref:Bacteriophage T5 Orf172 DNA-binding domain-containing protein n=1 Tax=Penicillium desertorum TaxID=1303715 RepID=A0A9X0BXE6_9EURO|nr:hypothetical protein N7530_001980 [Penicillium desertorum]
MMQSAMETPGNVFIYLSGLLEIAYGPMLKCVQLRGGTEPCGNKIARANLEPVKESFGHLYAILNEPDHKLHDKDGVFNDVLAELIKRCLCQRQHHQNSDDAKSQWLKELYNDEKRHQLRCKLQTYLFDCLEEESIISAPPETEFELCTSNKSSVNKYDVQLKVTAKLLEPLTKEVPGFVYLLSHPREPKMFKVGHTENPDKRFADHKRCYEDFNVVKKALVRFPHRIEQLMIAEYSLKHYKLKEKCNRCNQSHMEWLRGSEAKLMASFNKWVKFALTDKSPYDENGRFRSKTVALPPPAMDFKPSTPTSAKKGSGRRSTGTLPEEQPSPSRPSVVKSGIRVIEEGMSTLDLGREQASS